MERSIVGYLIFMEVLLGAWASSNSTCPYDNPATHAMTCIRDMPSVTYKHVSFQPRSTTAATNAKSSTAANRKRQAETADGKQEEGVSPMRTPEISLKFMQYFCSDAGAAMINCSSSVMEKCSYHPDMQEAFFNPEQARAARALCESVNGDLKKSLKCFNASMAADSSTDCVFNAYTRAFDDKDTKISHDTKMCRAVAGTYNCFAEIGGEECGQDIARFSIAVMRTMESRYCTPIVDARYRQPVSSSATILPTILTFVVAVLNFIF